jgi:hypothetical protein
MMIAFMEVKIRKKYLPHVDECVEDEDGEEMAGKNSGDRARYQEPVENSIDFDTNCEFQSK